jgi:hypothetical protein
MSDATAIASALIDILGNDDEVHSYCEACLRSKARSTVEHLASAAAHAERLGYTSAAEELFLSAEELDAQLA